MRQVRLKIKGKWSRPYVVHSYDGVHYIDFDFDSYYGVPVAIVLLRALGIEVIPAADKLPENVIQFPKRTKNA